MGLERCSFIFLLLLSLHFPPSLPSSNPSQSATLKFHHTFTSTSSVVRRNRMMSMPLTSSWPPLAKRLKLEKRIKDLSIADAC
ncbi:hypothetical protein F4604DRAFT_1795332 [Suillus subluteus]|nr:hypothetical protein F4604DRAFT_1795332 [Suillus subluteus]